MSRLPLIEAVLLEIHQSFGGDAYPTNKKNKFATGQNSLDAHKVMGEEVLRSIFDAMDMDPRAQHDAINNLMEFANAYKSIELITWTFAADQRQIIWSLLSHFFTPGLARRVAFWSLEQPLDKGMPGGHFWYLPEPRDGDGKLGLYLPVAQVVDWLLDLLGMPLEQIADQRSEDTDGIHEGLRRSLYNWRNDTPIRFDSIQKYFPDNAGLIFKGSFSPDNQRTPTQQFSDAMDFVRRKELTAEKLRFEIPMTAPGRLEAIFEGRADDDEQAVFVECLVDRYAAPSMHTVRQRLLLSRAVQDGYIRALKFLCPDVDRQCADPQQNKLLQVFALYKLVYNLTVDAWRHCRDQGEAAENAWFEAHLPKWDKCGLLLSILPSRRETANLELAHWLTRGFFEMQPGAELENFVGLDAPSAAPIIQRNVERALSFADEIRSELHVVDRLKTSSPWRTLQGENRFWVITQVAQNPDLGPLAKQAAVQRLRDLASTPAQTVQVILLELDSHLNGERKHRSKDTQAKVQSLLEEAEASEGYALWKAAILQYKAKHLLARNNFEGAGKIFREALEAGLERNYGPLRGEVARDCLALAVANGKLIANNHEKYYREMLAGGMMAEYSNVADIPSIEETARWAAEYFWDTLYKPYPGVQAEERRTSGIVKALLKDLMPLLMSGDQGGLSQWISANRALLKSPLPDVEGNSVLMSLIKMHTQFSSRLPLMRQMIPFELQGEQHRFETMLKNWRQFFGRLVKESPKQLNIADLKGQTPLMLMAEAGDTELVTIMLQAGADPNLQDWQGMTALHSACKSLVDGCVDALLDYRCALGKLTQEGRSPLHTASWAGHIHAAKRLSQLAPRLVWQRDANNMTPLELAESLIEQPAALEVLAKRRAQDGKRCASKKELEAIVHLFEQMPSLH